MGNTDSQYSSFIIPSRSRPCSLKINSSKEEALSPHSWWRSTGGGASTYKTRGSPRNGQNQHKNGQPYAPRHCEYIKSNNNNKQQHSSIQNNSKLDYECLLTQQNGCYVPSSSPRSAARSSGSEASHSRNSPKVLFSQDGSLRVEFTNSRPELDDVPKDSTLRDSKGSSLSSEASWYDSPWGAGTDLCDNVFTSGQPSDSSGYTTLSSTRTDDFSSCPTSTLDGHVSDLLHQPFRQARMNSNQYSSSVYVPSYSGCAEEDSGIGDSVLLSIEQKDFGLTSFGDLYTNPNLTGPFPTTGILPSGQVQDTPDLREESSATQAFSSLTLPCRKPVADSNSRKDSLKSRIRRLSDWTGSLSRKKRRLQEPSALEASEPFSSGVDGLLGDSSLQLGCGPYWSSLVSSQTQSACSLTDPVQQSQRQNVYENFMQELEPGGSSSSGALADTLQAWECDGEQGESSSGSLGSLEQMELLFEKEQGVVRRAGWLAFKPLINLHKERKLELVTRRRWRQYWVTLKGCTLLLSEANGKGCPEQDASPRYALQAEDSIVQAVPEHPKKEHVFCLSNAYGDVFLFQAANQTDLENWVTAIHSASASHLAKRQGKEDTVRLLRSQSKTLLQKIDMDSKMKKMAELQLTVISDQKNRKAVESQIQQWEQNLEKFNIELFRMRCYLASLQGSEPPNPKSLLAAAGRPSKMALSRLGIFSVSSFHALMCTRDEATLKRRSRCQSRAVRSKRGIFSSQKGLDSLTRRNHEKRQSLSQIFEGHPPATLCHPAMQSSSEQRLDGLAKLHSAAPPEGHSWDCPVETLMLVSMPDGQAVSVPVKQDFLVADLLCLACKGRQLDPVFHCLRVKRHLGQDIESFTPASTDLLRELVFDELEVCPLNVFILNMSRPNTATDFGFAVTGHVDGLRRSHVYVSEVHPEGLAFTEGLRAGDEILAVNGVSVSTLDLGLIHTFFSQNTLRLVLRREEPISDDQGSVWPECDPTDPYCPPPPPNHSHAQLGSSDVCQFLEVPGDSVVPLSEEVRDKAEACRKSVETTCTLYQPFPEDPGLSVDGYRNPYSTDSGPARGSPRHMSVTERLHKVIQELVDTEKSYVKDLGCLFEIYLKPLERQTFLSHGEMESLFGSLPEMLDFQRIFLQTLEERTTSSPDFRTLETPEQLRKLLFSLGGSFLYYADHFKLYSGFCANHIKVQKVLERAKTDRAFKEFLEARNPTKQHSSTLESYLIKPVQRVLKYPLLLKELVSLTDPDSEEHSHLTEALRAMEKVASHINEMQKIYEDYGTVFDQLVAEQSSTEKEVTEISMGEFIVHSSALWLNPMPSLGRMRKDPELTLFIFKRAVILVYRESSKLKKRMQTSSRSGDLDPFKFRWLIPASSVQVRPGNSAGSEDPCLWELVHTKSEVEGRPETVFQLCSSSLENKANAVKAVRSILRENSKRNVPAERGSRDNLTFPRRSHPAAVRTSSWLQRLQPQSDGLKRSPLDSEEGRLGGDTHSEPACAPRNESSSLSKRARLCSLTGSLEAQLQRLSFMDPQEATHKDSSGLQSSQLTLLEDTSAVDLNCLLARDCSVQNLNSVTNEDCFYDTVMGIQKAAIPTL
ncbi:T-lymphoma invasion and metastasis-inducing protein 2 isoform X1 [Pygocentrus nattereri]|uniref:T-lymphoma invasion and metastasis-inducing protein 2 isoform X1 n=1 Tax=Pygocentrus nattereri TaxID=42514 RepID=UPI0018913247|nr:T-lymphoma invasion and metastasis-inducing protein 2 isoform X1 [Pygocentrus nattereri]XP_037394104.1 T-lymphoma invasion and metastasis-inducing protein 2 isoform X1 [Pygocentrus nattereri]XP_037394105.1 T-lymphoma invasion and metastasis-inducing protein 2 isoform X1 [Pygocentrus nattereri]